MPTMDKLKKGLSSTLQKAKEGLHQAGPQDVTEAQIKPADQQPFRNPSEKPKPSSSQDIQRPAGRPLIPKLKSQPEILGLVGDPSLNRDSGGSVLFGDRILWTYRDTQICKRDGSVQMFPIISSTASWSDLASHGGPELTTCSGDALKSTVLHQYGKNSEHKSFFGVPGTHICDEPAGNRNDGTRVALWPDQPPLVTSQGEGAQIEAYTWVKQAHIGHDLSVKTENPATILYKTEYHASKRPGSKHDLPSTKVVNEQFWNQGEIPFGAYGNLVHEGYAYLYGQAENKTSLARVRVQSVEDRNAYEYWVEGRWSNSTPKLGQPGIEISNANAGGQGTYYYNHHWRCFVWIGGDIFPGAECYICTSPAPEGPWTQPKHFWTGPRGNHALGAYSIQAHPALCRDRRKNDMYITYTKNDEAEKGDVAMYTTPLVYVEFE